MRKVPHWAYLIFIEGFLIGLGVLMAPHQYVSIAIIVICIISLAFLLFLDLLVFPAKNSETGEYMIAESWQKLAEDIFEYIEDEPQIAAEELHDIESRNRHSAERNRHLERCNKRFSARIRYANDEIEQRGVCKDRHWATKMPYHVNMIGMRHAAMELTEAGIEYKQQLDKQRTVFRGGA